MGEHKKLVNYFGENYPAEIENYLEFLTNALLYINNVNGAEVFESTYSREYDDTDSYCAGKVDALQNRFDSWFLSLDLSNRKRFVEAVMHYMKRGSRV